MGEFSNLPKINKPNLFIAVPMAKNAVVHAETAAYCSLLNQHPDVKWGFVTGMTPEFSRNTLIEHHFHNDPCWTHMVFLDSDVVPPADGLVKLLQIEADVAVGVCPIIVDKQPAWNVKHKTEDRWFRMSENLPVKPFAISSCGAGFLLVRREVLVGIGWPWFHAEFQEIFKNDGKGIKTGEDVWFCEKVLKAGYKVIAHPEVLCKHYNQVDLLAHYNMCKAQLEAECES